MQHSTSATSNQFSTRYLCLSEQSADTQSKNAAQLSTANISTESPVETPRVAGHKISLSELETLQAGVGVYKEGQNYSLQVDGYGTGMVPPKESEWAEIGESLY